MLYRSYQLEARDRTLAAWERGVRSVLGVAATGLGKTIIFASIIDRIPGRVMVLAHREELIFQAADKTQRVTGHEADIEMADLRAAEMTLTGKAKVIVSTIQTQGAGKRGGRMQRFNPAEFDLLIIDEAHHATSKSWRKVIKHYRQNPNLRVLGVTATPDRSDKVALGKVFDEVAFDYDLRFGIDEGWLVPVEQRAVHVSELDFSACRTTAGDLNRDDLAAVMEHETNLQQVAAPTIDLTKDGRKTLIFTSSLKQADRMCEILNRYRDGSACWVSGKTPKKDRRQLFKAYAKGEFQYLINVGVATEGFDEPSIEVVVMARPTKSRALYCQMVGRGTRTLPGVVDHPGMFGSPAMRRAAIAASAKPHVEIIDFVGNCGRHKLVTTADILGGRYGDDVVERARANVERDGKRNMLDALNEAQEQIRKEREEAKRREAARRANLVAKAQYTTSRVDPFDVLGIEPVRDHSGRRPTERMLAMLERQDVDTRGLTFAEASRIIRDITRRWDAGECSFRQARILRQRGKPTDVSYEEANRMIDEIARREGWGKRKQARKPRRKVADVVRY